MKAWLPSRVTVKMVFESKLVAPDVSVERCRVERDRSVLLRRLERLRGEQRNLGIQQMPADVIHAGRSPRIRQHDDADAGLWIESDEGSISVCTAVMPDHTISRESPAQSEIQGC